MSDIIDRAARVLHEHYRRTDGLDVTAQESAQALADAGLLRAPAQAEMERLTRLIADTTALTGADAKTLVEAVQKLGKPTRTVPTRDKLTDVIYPFDRGQKIHVLTDKGLAELKAQALEEAADAWHADNAGTSPRAYRWLQNRAQQIRDGK